MRQFQFEYRDPISFRKEINKTAQWCRSIMHSAVVFDVYAQMLSYDTVNEVCEIIKQVMPNALFRGCSTNGNIFEGTMSRTPVSISCTIFEYPDTRVEMMQLHLDSESEKSVVRRLEEYVRANPWIRAIEMLVTIRSMSMTSFCPILYGIDFLCALMSRMLI